MKRLLYCLMAGLFLPIILVAQCPNEWVRQISGLPTGNLANNSPSLAVDLNSNTIVSNGIYGADTIVTDGQVFPETSSIIPPTTDFFVAKYDWEGSLQWLNTILGEGGCVSLDIALDDQANIYVGGIMQNSINVNGTLIERPIESLPDPGYFILKFNPQGQLQWYHKGDYKGSRCYQLAWTGEEIAFVIPYSDSVEIGGSVFYSDGNSFYQDMVLGKLDSDGSLISAVNIGGEGNVEIHALGCDEQGCILQGRFDQELSYGGVTVSTPAENHFELYQMSIGTDYSLDWMNVSQGASGIDPRAYGLGLTDDGSAYFSGNYWNSSFTLDGFQLPAPAQNDFFTGGLNRLDGTIVWLKRGEGSSYESSFSLQTHLGSIWVGGSFYSNNLDYEGYAFENTNDNEFDGFLLSLDQDGKPDCGIQLIGNGQNGIRVVSAFADGHAALLAYFNGTVEFGGQTYTAQGNYDLLVIKTCLPCDTLTSIAEAENGQSTLNIYPNPASQSVRVETTGNSQQLTALTITNMLGHAVLHQKTTANDNNIDISGLASGLYTVAATFDNGETARRRLVVH